MTRTRAVRKEMPKHVNDDFLELGVDTFVRNVQLSTLGNLDRFNGTVHGALGHILDQVDDVVTLQDLSEDDVAAIEPAMERVNFTFTPSLGPSLET